MILKEKYILTRLYISSSDVQLKFRSHSELQLYLYGYASRIYAAHLLHHELTSLRKISVSPLSQVATTPLGTTVTCGLQ